MLALLLFRPSPALFLIAIVAIPQLRMAWNFDPKAPENAAYYNVSAELKLEYAVMYFGLAALLGIMTYSVHAMID
jgi:hypothetical protein